ncbi:MAG: ribonuclease R [Alloprevotella sp.]|nr:ribonuclease R [Alloprevotella sp.]
MKSKSSSTPRLKRRDMTDLLLQFFQEHPTGEYTPKTLFNELKAKTHPAKMLLLDALEDLVRDDYLKRTSRGSYTNATPAHVMEGTFVRKRNGRNSFLPDDGGQSILVAERNSLHALDGDRVRATMLARRRNHTREAVIIEVLEHTKNSFVGTIHVEHGYGFLITESRSLAVDIFIPKANLKGAKNGDKVLVEITSWPQDAKSPIGKVKDIFGSTGNNDAEMNAILAEFELPYRYPQKVVEAADRIPEEIPTDEIQRREDFRSVLTFTIDPHDAKDFDDALSIRKVDDGDWEVGVHIADVSYYVRENDTIDREARQRATSIYLVDRTIPMLPEKLCNFLCSLRPDEDKLAYSVIFRLSDKAEVKAWHLAHTVIRSNRRFAYEEVQEILERNNEASPEDLQTGTSHPTPLPKGHKPEGEYAEELITLNRLAKQFRAARFKHGSVAFDRPEIRFDIDETGHPVSTYIKIAKDANKLVEEFMLLANRTVAESIGRVPKGVSAKVLPYRIHDVPDTEKLEKLSAFVGLFGYRLKTDGGKTAISKSLNKLLSDVQGKREAGLIELVTLRAMQKAQYSTTNIGHYGLMFDYYTHFTSPIRRYPDLMVHRLLTRYAEGGRSANKEKYEDLCEHSSAMEQLAEQAERASIKYKQVEFMADRLGQEFEGTISGVSDFGIYVELTENGCEGLIPIRNLDDDYYEYDERNYCLSGRRNHRRYSLGDKVSVRVERADIDKRLLDFELVGVDKHKREARIDLSLPRTPKKTLKRQKNRR